MPSQRKGGKSRKAAKELKARQTRKHREARQERRDRKNRRDYPCETRRVESTNTSFRRFPELPLELRELVWEKCIPSRLVIHGILFPWDQLSKFVLRSQRRPPIISQIGHEARGVVLRHGSRITIGPWCRGANGFLGTARLIRSNEMAWFDTRRDTLVLFQTQYTKPNVLFTSVPTWLDVSNDAVIAAKTSGRLSCMGPYPWSDKNRSTIDTFGSEWLHEADVGYVVKRYYLLAPLSAIIQSGHFGLFGENRAITVDLHDTDTIRALKKLRSRYCHYLKRGATSLDGRDGCDINDLPEIDTEQVPEHDQSWWLPSWMKTKFIRQRRIQFKQLFDESPKTRLLALVFCVVDD